jgi:putative SOS response-associated peptidase YedK
MKGAQDNDIGGRLTTLQHLSRTLVLFGMCGRYTQTGDLQELMTHFRIDSFTESIRPRFNIAPTQNAPVIVWENGRVLKQMRWGLVPNWAKDEKIGSKMINARSETLAEKPSFKRLLVANRCLVLADGFFEWRPSVSGKSKAPVRILLKDSQPFAFAGLWDSWKRLDGSEIQTFTIITTVSNETIRPFHHRMPVILNSADEDIWLKSNNMDSADLEAVLRPYPAELMTLYEVPKRVNSPKNDSPDCITPAS